MTLIILILLALVVVMLFTTTLKIIRQQQVAIVERLGKFRKVLDPGPHLVVPFPPQGVITEDNLIVSIDSVIYFQIVDPVRAAYEAQNYRAAIEQLTMTTLRNIIGGMDLEATLTSREEINQRLRAVLDEATGKWGIKVNRVELRAIEPPPTIRDAMEKGARAERDKRASILLAEGQRQSQILSAGGDREAAVLRAQGDREAAVLRAQADRQAQMLRAEGEAQAITTVFSAIHAAEPDQALLAYQYMQMLPRLASGDSNKMWIVPSELSDALKGLGQVANATGSPHRIRWTCMPRSRSRQGRIKSKARRRLNRPSPMPRLSTAVLALDAETAQLLCQLVTRPHGWNKAWGPSALATGDKKSLKTASRHSEAPPGKPLSNGQPGGASCCMPASTTRMRVPYL